MARGWLEKVENFGPKRSMPVNLISYFLHILIVFEESCLTCTAMLLLCLPSFLFHKAIALLITASALLGFVSMTLRMRIWQEVRCAEKSRAAKSPEIFFNVSRASITWSSLIAWFWLNYTFKFNDFTDTRWFISNLLSISGLAVLFQLFLYRY